MNTAFSAQLSDEGRSLLAQLDVRRLPRHLAVIMDGNGRWATQQGLPRVFGHRAGVNAVRAAINFCQDLDIPYLTLYSFSTENWQRPPEEVQALMALIEEQFRAELEMMHRNGVRIRHLGRLDGLPDSLQATLRDVVERTRANPGVTLIFAINYSGRVELLDAARRLAAEAAAGRLDPAALTEAQFRDALYLPDVPDPDLLIRTAGEMRVSNYLLWQIAYAEFWSTPVLWPDCRAEHFLAALVEYQHRQRKYGRIAS